MASSEEGAYAFLDVMGNHEQFTDHMLRDWQLSGPERGVGARANVTAVMGGRSEPVAIEVVDAEEPRTIVERNVGAGGKRVAHGTYRLAPACWPAARPSPSSTPGSRLRP